MHKGKNLSPSPDAPLWRQNMNGNGMGGIPSGKGLHCPCLHQEVEEK